jgi:hypothetical protein
LKKRSEAEYNPESFFNSSSPTITCDIIKPVPLVSGSDFFISGVDNIENNVKTILNITFSISYDIDKLGQEFECLI